MASRAHLRRNTSTPPPGGYGGDGTDDDQSRTSDDAAMARGRTVEAVKTPSTLLTFSRPILSAQNNFFLLFKTLNTKLNFESWANFKKEYTGDAWFGVIYFVRRAIELETRLYPAA